MTAKHLPGPWSVLPGVPAGGGVAIGPELEGIGPHAMVQYNGGASEANALLISAAPDLLAAAQAVQLATIADTVPAWDEAFALVRAAIAAARGESN